MSTAVRDATKADVVAALERAREATLRLVEPLDDELLLAQVSPLMSPLVWDLAHIGWFEELWLVRRLGGEAQGERFDDVYDAFRHARSERSGLPILTRARRAPTSSASAATRCKCSRTCRSTTPIRS